MRGNQISEVVNIKLRDRKKLQRLLGLLVIWSITDIKIFISVAFIYNPSN